MLQHFMEGCPPSARRVSRKLRNRVAVAATGDREPLFKLLRERVGRRLCEAIAGLRDVRDLSLTHFVDACRSGKETLNGTFGITLAQAERLAQAEP